MKSQSIVLAKRPVGLPVEDDFAVVDDIIDDLDNGQVLVEHSHLGLAPAARIRMSTGAPGYAAPLAIGEVIYGGAVGCVIESRNPAFPVGQAVVSIDGGWRTHAVSDGNNLKPVDLDVAPATSWLGALGISGFTAYVGLLDIARLDTGESVVVSAAAGAVGSVAAQIAGIRGADVVGVAGSERKCRQVESTYGVSVCVDYHAPDFAQRLTEACPGGVDIYFDNVGGTVRDAVWPLLNQFGRVVVCGQISQYNRTTAEPGPDWYPVLTHCLSVQGFLVSNHTDRYNNFREDMSRWIRQHRITTDEYIVKGLEATPSAFIDMLSGRSHGKTIVEL